MRRSTCAISRTPRTRGEGEREIEEDDLTTAFYENDEIDLGQLMQEQFYLSLPMKPLCAGDCKGLCPMCGTNLNRGTCACDPQWEDPRLAALKALRGEERILRRCLIQNDDTPRPARPSAGRTTR